MLPSPRPKLPSRPNAAPPSITVCHAAAATALARELAATALLGLAVASGAHAACSAEAPDPAAMHDAEVAYLPTPHAVVEAMLDLAGVSANDVVYDLGAGDGRIVVAAAATRGLVFAV